MINLPSQMGRTLKTDFIASLAALRKRDGGDALDGLVKSLREDEPAVAVRVNRNKFEYAVSDRRRVPWSRNGFYIDGERPRFTFDPALHQGLYYVQDPSSMVMERIVGALTGDTPVVYIDACAAPGGKTTAAMNMLPAGSLVIANEYDRRRVDVLVENIIKWGYPDVVVTNDDTSKFRKLGEIADIVAADVPCSGEGMMRKEEVAVEQWSPALVAQCAGLQRTIIDNIWSALKPGGYFIYSTCTFNHEENEDNLAYMVEELGAVPLDPLSLIGEDLRGCGIKGAIDSRYPAARFIPGMVEGEGLFVAVLRKPGVANEVSSVRRKKEGRPGKLKGDIECVAKWIKEAGRAVEVVGDTVTALPVAWQDIICEVRRVLRVVYVGLEVARIKGRDVIPSQSLAMSGLLNEKGFQCVEVDYETALRYLSRQAIAVDAPKGILLLKYGGHPLGFVKNLGNRANNMYPSQWAIRSSHFPDTPPVVI